MVRDHFIRKPYNWAILRGQGTLLLGDCPHFLKPSAITHSVILFSKYINNAFLNCDIRNELKAREKKSIKNMNMHFPPMEPLGFTYLVYNIMRFSHTAYTSLLCWLWQKYATFFRLTLEQRSANVSYKGPDPKHLRLCETYGLSQLLKSPIVKWKQPWTTCKWMSMAVVHQDFIY